MLTAVQKKIQHESKFCMKFQLKKALKPVFQKVIKAFKTNKQEYPKQMKFMSLLLDFSMKLFLS